MNIKPFSDDNSIKGVAFAVDFDVELSWSDVHDTVNKAEMSDIFGGGSHFGHINYPSFIHSPNGVYEENILGGFLYEDGMPKINWDVMLNKQGMIIRCMSYAKWNEVSVRALEYISACFNVLPEDIDISNLTLEYLDEFEISSGNDNWTKELFNEESGYINANIHKMGRLFHLHQGLLNDKKEFSKKVDINSFIDSSDNNHKVHIVSQCKTYLNSSSKSNMDFIKTNFKIMHEQNKEAFLSVINKDITNKFK